MKHALIEEQIPLAAVNEASAKEKHLRHGHISTMHLWWARRPLAMSRAVVFASLVPDPQDEDRRRELQNAIAMAAPFKEANSGDSARIKRLAAELSAVWQGRRPKVLDCFAGGGAIPLEALRLGCDVTATDINPVAHILQRCVLEYPARFGGRDGEGRLPLVDDFTRWAQWVRDRADERLAEVYPSAGSARRVAAYFWARTIPCADQSCGRTIPIISSRKLADSSRRKVGVEYDVFDDRVELRVVQGVPKGDGDWKRGTKTSRGSSVTVTCPACGSSWPDRELRAYAREHGFGQYLYAVMEGGEAGRSYREPDAAEVEAAESALKLLDQLDEYPEGTSAVPDERLVDSQYRTLRQLTWGIKTWADGFTPRQRYVLAVLAQTVRAAHEQMLAEGMAPDRAKALATYLALAVDRIADYSSTFTGWLPSHEKVTHTFPQQAIRMAWDFVEIDPIHADVSGNWSSAIGWISKALTHCCTATAGNPADVRRANAQELPFDDGEFDAVIIDPPYYDAFQYGDLSDYFYVWLKRSIGHLYPELFLTPLTPKQAEVIENRADKKSAEYVSHAEFEKRLQRALHEVARVVSDDGIVSLVFAHTDVAAWERLLQALRHAGLIVTTSWPMQSEREGRTTDNVGSVLGSSVVLVCRKSGGRGDGFYDDVVRELDERLTERLATFEEMRLGGADYFVSAVGPAFEVFARYSRVLRMSGEEVSVRELMVLAREAVARHAMRKLLGSETLTALDDRSLFYLTWRWAYDGHSIAADDAYMLCRAFNLDLDLLIRRGLVERRGSGGDRSYRLLGPRDRSHTVLGDSPDLIDVMHVACRLHAEGRMNELAEVLGATGAANEPGFWAMVTAIAEALPDGDDERSLLRGLGGNRDGISEAAARHTGSTFGRLF